MEKSTQAEFILWAFNEDVPGLITSRTNLGSELFQIASGMGTSGANRFTHKTFHTNKLLQPLWPNG